MVSEQDDVDITVIDMLGSKKSLASLFETGERHHLLAKGAFQFVRRVLGDRHRYPAFRQTPLAGLAEHGVNIQSVPDASSFSGEGFDYIVDLLADPELLASVQGKRLRFVSVNPVVSSNSPLGFWEYKKGLHVIEQDLCIVDNDTRKFAVLESTASSVDRLKIMSSVEAHLWKLSAMLLRNVPRLDEEEREWKPLYRDSGHGQPRLYHWLTLMISKFGTRVSDYVRARFFERQWGLLYSTDLSVEDLITSTDREATMSPLLPPRGVSWADPFCVTKDGIEHIFFEEYSRDNASGRIVVSEVTRDGVWHAPVAALETGHHLSYPFLIEHDGKIFLIPEEAEQKKLNLYCSSEFPDRWELCANLFEGKRVYDATVVQWDGRFWMFANVTELDGMSSWDELYIFYSDSLQGPWASHARNPVLSDCRLARPAGRLFVVDGALYRPSQKSGFDYGYGLNISRIDSLTPSEYSQMLVTTISPVPGNRLTGIHSVCVHGGRLVADGNFRRFRFGRADVDDVSVQMRAAAR